MNDSSQVEEAVEAWLHGQDVPEEWREVMSELDGLYTKSANQRLKSAALTQLKEALEEARRSAIFYAVLKGTLIGHLWVACREDSLIAMEIGVSEGRFVSRLEQAFDGHVIRSQEHTARILDQLKDYFAGSRQFFELPLSLERTTEFQRRVLQATSEIPYGQVSTYGEVAQRIGKPKSARAVGQVLARNPIPIVIPCHRVLGADGSLHGYSGGKGLETKAQLLRLEGVLSCGGQAP